MRPRNSLFLLADILPKSIPCPVRHTAMRKLTSAQQRRRNEQLGIATAQATHSATVQKSAKELDSQLSTQCPQGSLIIKKEVRWQLLNERGTNLSLQKYLVFTLD